MALPLAPAPIVRAGALTLAPGRWIDLGWSFANAEAYLRRGPGAVHGRTLPTSRRRCSPATTSSMSSATARPTIPHAVGTPPLAALHGRRSVNYPPGALLRGAFSGSCRTTRSAPPRPFRAAQLPAFQSQETNITFNAEYASHRRRRPRLLDFRSSWAMAATFIRRSSISSMNSDRSVHLGVGGELWVSFT